MPPTLNSSERFRDLILGAHQTYPLYSNGQLARTIIAENNLDETFYTMKKRVEIILNDYKKKTQTQASAFSLTPSDIEAATDFNLPKSMYEEILPVEIPPRYNNTLVLSDIHLPYQDNEAVRLALKYGKEQGVNHIILNGDIIDC